MSKKDDFSGTASGYGFLNMQSYLRTAPADVAEFCSRVIESGFDRGNEVADVTLRFFKWIENNQSLLHQYQLLRDRIGQWQLNAQIGRWIKEHYNLSNGPIAQATGTSLIKAYTTHSHS